MSKGNRMIGVRVEPDLLARIEVQIAQRNLWTRNTPWALSDFVRAAMEQMLAKMERSRKSRGKRK